MQLALDRFAEPGDRRVELVDAVQGERGALLQTGVQFGRVQAASQ
ncbi:hypothetical protein ACWGJX_43030 [Streptomyces sp. NPDC054775]